MAGNGNGFWREKFFYIVLLLLVGSFGWTTFIGWGATQSIKDVSAESLKRDEKIKDEHTEDMKDLTVVLNRIDNKLTEIGTEQRVMKELLKKGNE